MKAAILAGGLGTRLRPLTFTKSKPMIPLVNSPVIEHIIAYLKSHRIRDIAITTNYRRDELIGHLGTGDRYGVRLSYPVEETPLGTAGSVKNIEGYFDRTFVVIQGDNITDINLRDLIKFHKKSGGLCTIAVKKVEDSAKYGVVRMDDHGMVTEFIEKPGNGLKHNLINTGLYVMEPGIFEYIPKNQFFDFSRDLFPVMKEKGLLYGKRMSGFWSDIGDPSGYKAAQSWMLQNLEESHMDYPNVEIRNAVHVGDNVSLGNGTMVIGPVAIDDDTIIEDDCMIGPNTMISRGSVIKSGTCILGSVFFNNVRIGEKSHTEGCMVAEDCTIGYGSTIQTNAMIGSNCRIGYGVDIMKDSRIWPGMEISAGTEINGTFRRFQPVHFVNDEIAWRLRGLSQDEAFYFNKCENNAMMFTGRKAFSLKEFRDILKDIETSSVSHHLRYDINDFSDWIRKVICDARLADDLERVKREVGVGAQDDVLRSRLVKRTTNRLYDLVCESTSHLKS
ncbi:MAG: DUF5752 family protein [Candidatus Altiarchaeota archaeon]